MNINDAFGNYLKKEDILKPTIVTISHVEMEEITSEGKTENRPVMYFVGGTKGLVVNKSNATTLTALLGPETDAWQGKRITLYVDPSIMYSGRKVGGLRVRGAGARPVPATRRTAPPPPVEDEYAEAGPELTDDDIPF